MQKHPHLGFEVDISAPSAQCYGSKQDAHSGMWHTGADVQKADSMKPDSVDNSILTCIQEVRTAELGRMLYPWMPSRSLGSEPWLSIKLQPPQQTCTWSISARAPLVPWSADRTGQSHSSPTLSVQPELTQGEKHEAMNTLRKRRPPGPWNGPGPGAHSGPRRRFPTCRSMCDMSTGQSCLRC